MTVRTGNTGSVLPFLAAAGRWRADGQRGPPSSAQRTAVFCQSAADVQPHRSIELAIEPARLSFSLCPRACRVALFCGQRHRAAAYILLNLDAAPPVTFATRRAASSVLSSSSCFSRSALFLLRSSCTFSFMAACGGEQSGAGYVRRDVAATGEASRCGAPGQRAGGCRSRGGRPRVRECSTRRYSPQNRSHTFGPYRLTALLGLARFTHTHTHLSRCECDDYREAASDGGAHHSLHASRGSLQRAPPWRRAKAAIEHRTKSKSAAPALAAAGIVGTTTTDAGNQPSASSAGRRRREPCI